MLLRTMVGVVTATVGAFSAGAAGAAEPRYALYSSLKSPPGWDIQEIDLDSGDTRSTGLRGISPNWSPDGHFVAFTRFQRRSATSLPGDRLWVSDDKGRSRIVRPKSLTHGVSSPVWSHSGRTIAFICEDTDGTSAICTVAPDGSRFRVVTRFPESLVDTFSWS